jgi:AcrR family transcriptional regulator
VRHSVAAVSTPSKGRLALAAVREVGARPFDEVTVVELAAAAEVTTGALDHHFGSKLGLYTFVRDDVERRLLDRVEGAVVAAGDGQDGSAAVRTALLVGFDFAVREGFLHILGTPPSAPNTTRSPTRRRRASFLTLECWMHGANRLGIASHPR